MEIEALQQQHDRIEEGKELKRENEVTDISQIPSKELPGAEKSLLTKISEGFNNVANSIGEAVGFNKDLKIEGTENLDKSVKTQVKKINREIKKKRPLDSGKFNEKGIEGIEKLNPSVRKQIKAVNKEISKRPLDKGGFNEKAIVGTEKLDKSVKQQIKAINKEISRRPLSQSAFNENAIQGIENFDKSTRKQLKAVNKEVTMRVQGEAEVYEAMGQSDTSSLRSKKIGKPIIQQVKEAVEGFAKNTTQVLGEGSNKIKEVLVNAGQKIAGKVTETKGKAAMKPVGVVIDKENVTQVL